MSNINDNFKENLDSNNVLTLTYTLQKNDNRNYVIFFNGNTDDSFLIELNEYEYNICKNIIIDSNFFIPGLNIINIYSILRSAESILLSAFLCVDDRDGSYKIRITFFPTKGGGNVSILDFDLISGLCLVYLCGHPLNIRKELFPFK